MKLTGLALLAVVASSIAPAPAASSSSNDQHAEANYRHRSLVRRVRNSVERRGSYDPYATHMHQKRFSGRASFYQNNLSEGACGGYTQPSDFVVAMNAAQYGDSGSVSSWCGKQIDISYGGVTQTATVVDCCPGCPYGGLDMSKGLFSSFTGLGTGIFQMTWQPSGGGGGGGGNSQKSSNNNNNDDNNNDDSQQQKTTTKHTTAAHTTTKHTTTSSSTTSSSTTTSSTTSSSTTSSSPAAGAATPAPGSTDGTVNNIGQMRLAMQGMLNMANAVH